jgi:NTE family protein
MSRRATLVLSGGGTRGAFQVGAERVLREEGGFEWERILGVSVGALNGTLLAQGQYEQVMDLWLTLREEDVYRKFSWPRVGLRLVMRKLGFYDNTPMRESILKRAAGRPYKVPVHVGRVSLVSGQYELVSYDEPGFLDAVWESATMPVIWEAVGPKAHVDGGIRNMTPLGDALEYEPTELVVILCGNYQLDPAPPPRTIVDVARRSLGEVVINEILINDVREFLNINHVVRQAAEHGVALTDLDGKPYRHYPITIIQSEHELGDSLDFSPNLLRARILAGEEAARKALQVQRAPPPHEEAPPLHA